jgi:hypothetical protein
VRECCEPMTRSHEQRKRWRSQNDSTRLGLESVAQSLALDSRSRRQCDLPQAVALVAVAVGMRKEEISGQEVRRKSDLSLVCGESILLQWPCG